MKKGDFKWIMNCQIIVLVIVYQAIIKMHDIILKLDFVESTSNRIRGGDERNEYQWNQWQENNREI